MLPIGFVIFPYFIKILIESNYKKTFINYFLYGFFFGFGFLLIYLSWIHNPFLVYEDTKSFAALSLLLIFFLSIFFGLSFELFKISKQPVYIILATPFVFISTEFIISNILYGFPWISFSLILSNNLFGFYLIKYFGTLTSGFLIILIFSITTFLFYSFKINKSKKLIIFLYLPFFFIFLAPIYHFFFYKSNTSKELKIDIYQIVKPLEKINEDKIEQDIIDVINTSESDLIIFAENNFPYLIDLKNDYRISKYIKNNKKVIIGGTRHENGKYYNSFFLFENDKIKYFDKKILVPFGEFLPFRKYLKFMESITGTFDFETGKKERILITDNNLKILPIICYEIIFDKIFNNNYAKEINILINITNDLWFGNKIGPYQHFYITRTKSLIANKPLVRVSNNGISAIINENGKILESTNLNQESNINYKIEINSKPNYIIFHKLFSYYLLFIFIILLIINRNNLNETN